MKTNLRRWQEEAINKALSWFEKGTDKRFLINAAPGAGKTICASVIANELFQQDKIDMVIVVAPRTEVVNQWKDEFEVVTKRKMIKVSSIDSVDDYDGIDVCSTWNAIQNLKDVFQIFCKKRRVLVICDEHHHAAINAVWGTSAFDAFENSRYVIVLTGTPIRTDGSKPVWFSYSEDRKKQLTHPQEGTYTLTYGECVNLNYCRPAFFHRHRGKFSVVLKEGGQKLTSASADGVSFDMDDIGKEIKSSIQKSLDFYTLARMPLYEKDNKTPRLDTYQKSMLEWGISKLENIQNRMPNAAGLVIAPNIKVAEFMAKLIEMLTTEKPSIVHYNIKDPNNIIDAFRNNNKNWIVSVGMISEGVDIKRLRLLVYLPSSQTELSFRQAIGRVVRSYHKDDDTSAYIVMPEFNIFEEYARRIEDEMQHYKVNVEEKEIKTKVCPKCGEENDKSNKNCIECEYEFPEKKQRFKKCEKCHHENLINSQSCQNCGEEFGLEFELTLDEALRQGGIARGVDINEEDVTSEEEYKKIRKIIEASGDARFAQILSLFPEEALKDLTQRLNKIFN